MQDITAKRSACIVDETADFKLQTLNLCILYTVECINSQCYIVDAPTHNIHHGDATYCSTSNKQHPQPREHACSRTCRQHTCSHVTAGLPEPEQCGASCSAAHAPQGPAGCHLGTQAQGQQPHAPCYAAAGQLPHWQLPAPHWGPRGEAFCPPLSLSSLSAGPVYDMEYDMMLYNIE